MSHTVAVLKDNLLVVTGIDRSEQMREMIRYFKDEGIDLHIVAFPDTFDLVDMRDAPPAVTEAAKLVDEYLRRAHG